jgi:hypothetical protein
LIIPYTAPDYHLTTLYSLLDAYQWGFSWDQLATVLLSDFYVYINLASSENKHPLRSLDVLQSFPKNILTVFPYGA